MTIRIISALITQIISLFLIAGTCFIVIKFIEFLYNHKDTGRYYKLDYSSKKEVKTNSIHEEYYRSTYYLSTHLSYSAVIHDKGRCGEYIIFRKLQAYENNGSRFLFNCYLPKGNNQTTEIDIILLTLNGIFVFESKNYSGWIYGSENQEIWTQTLPAGNKIHKEHFYNPIIQNKSHIKALKYLIGNTFPIYSVIVFSDYCELKNITASDPMTEIVCFGSLNSIVKHLLNQQPNSLTQDTLISIYNKLYPYTQVPEEVKRKHAEDVQAKKTRI